MQNKDNPNLFKDSINKESAQIGHPEDSPSFALNANVDGFRGNGFRYQTEAGNELCYEVPEGYIIIGKIYITDNTLAVFSTDNINSEIGIVKDCTYEVLYNDTCLNFNTKYPISGQARIRKGCEKVIYWNDYYNPDRYLNIDEFQRCGIVDCSLLNFNPEVIAPCIDLVSVNNQGGKLPMGTYSVGIEILDANENLVYRSDLSRKVPIYDEFTTDEYSNIDGGLNIDIYSPEIGGVPITNKSITFSISDLDTKFSFIRVFVRRAITGDGVVTDSHVLGNLIPITSETLTFTYTGFNVANGDYTISNSETVIPKVIYDRSRSMEQVQNRLLRANISEPYIDVSNYQQSASKIWAEWITSPEQSSTLNCLKLVGTIFATKDLKACPTLISYTITYTVGGEVKTVTNSITNNFNSIFEIEQVIDCVQDQDITDVNLNYTFLHGGCDSATAVLDWTIDQKEVPEFTDSSKDPNTYWFDSSFMDDEIYSFGIGFNHTSGYTSPMFHIPGTPKDIWIKEGDCLPLGKLTSNGKFLLLEGDITVGEGCSVSFEYNVTFKVNGVFHERSDTLLFSEDSELNVSLYWGLSTDNITDVVLDYTCTSVNDLGEPCANSSCDNIAWNIKSIVIVNNEADSHIIETWSADLIPFTDLSEDDYNDLDSEDKLQMWQVYNTARGNGLEGRMGYYECSEATYQKPDSCCIEDYWGYDYCNHKLEGTPIRHHRFPCKSLFVEKGFKLGVRFHNVTYPSSDIVSHFFVVGKRTEENKTVLDQGFAGNLGKDMTRTGFSFFQPNLGNVAAGVGLFNDCTSRLALDEERLWYMTPRMLFNKEYINGSYMKFIKRVLPNSSKVTVIEVDEIDPRTDDSTDVFLGVRVNCYGQYVPKFSTEQMYYPIYKNYILDPYSEFQDAGQTITNMSHTNKVGVLRTNDVFKLTNKALALVSFKVNKDVYCNLDAIEYVRMHNCNFELADSYDVFGGDVFVNNLSIANSFIWKLNQNYLKAIASAVVLIAAAALLFIPGIGQAAFLAVGLQITATVVAILGGLSLLGAGANIYKSIQTHYDNFKRGKFRNFMCDSQANKKLDDIDEDLEDYVGIMTEFINDFNLTSEVNIALRHQGANICGTYPRFTAIDDICEAPKDKLYAYLRDKLTYFDDGSDEVKALEIFCPEFYGYNKDYSLIYGEKTYFGVPSNFDFCRACTNEFKNTIVYSEKSFDTEEKDNFLVYKINNSIDVPAHRGEIFNLKHKSNILYVQCKETTFVIQPNPQVMKTDKDIVTLGTGDFLSLPPQELMQTDVGYGGCQSTTCHSNTEHGFVWLDQSKGEIYNIASGLEEISQLKMEPWFKENLPSEFNKIFFNTFGEDYPFMNSVTDSIGLGVVCVYDPKHERIIIHKKDYKPLLPLSQDLNDISQGKIFFNGSLFFTNLKFQKGYPVSFEDKDYFENRSWTISYSLKYKKWLSYHSYLPLYMYNDRNFYYTIDDNKIYKHLHNGNYLNYYGVKFPFILEGIHTSLQTEDLHAFHYVSQAEEFNIAKDVFIAKPFKTFNQAYFYNLDETTGLLTLQYLDLHTNPYGNISLPENVKSVILTDENYKISGLRDVAVSSPVISKSWSDTQGYFNINSSRHGYIDQVPINFDHSAATYELKDLNDKLIVYRLIFNPDDEDIRLSLILQNNFTFISNR